MLGFALYCYAWYCWLRFVFGWLFGFICYLCVGFGLLDVLFGGWCVVLLVCVMFADFWVVLFGLLVCGCLCFVTRLWCCLDCGLLVWVGFWLTVLIGLGLVVGWYCLLLLFWLGLLCLIVLDLALLSFSVGWGSWLHIGYACIGVVYCL